MQIATIGSNESGHSTYPGRTTGVGSSNVFAAGRGVHRLGDSWGSHCNTVPPYDCHDGTTASGSGSVFANGKQVARVGDSISCGGNITTGINSVRVGG